MKVYGVNPRGYCLGVIKAIDLVIKTRKNNPNSNIFIYGMLVHNDDVVSLLEKENIITLNYTDGYEQLFNSLPRGSFLVFTAHGHSEKLEKCALEAGLITLDATCSRVKENMNLIKKEEKIGNEVIYIGKKNHPETVAALSTSSVCYLYDVGKEFNYSNLKTLNPLVINQTTLSFLDLEKEHIDIKKKLPNARIIDEICDATKLRQVALLNLPKEIDYIIVVGGSNSSNTNKLLEIAKQKYPNTPSSRILNYKELNKNDLKGRKYVAVISGTSTPIDVTNKIISFIKELD